MRGKNISFVLELIWCIFWFLIAPAGGVFCLSYFIFHTSVIDTYYMTALFFLIFFYIFGNTYNIRLKFHPIMEGEKANKVIKLMELLWRFSLVTCALILFILDLIFEDFTIIQIILQFVSYGIILGVVILCVKIAIYFVMKTFKNIPEDKTEFEEKVELWKKMGKRN